MTNYASMDSACPDDSKNEAKKQFSLKNLQNKNFFLNQHLIAQF